MGWAGWETSEAREAISQDYPGLSEKTILLFAWLSSSSAHPTRVHQRKAPAWIITAGDGEEQREASRANPAPKYFCHSCKAGIGEGTHSMKAGSSRVCWAWC